MHLCTSQQEFVNVCNIIIARWRGSIPAVQRFSEYFEQQWLDGCFLKWAIHWTEEGRATTNNPNEGFNARIKEVWLFLVDDIF